MTKPLLTIACITIVIISFSSCEDDDANMTTCNSSSEVESIIYGQGFRGISSIKIDDTGQKVFDEFGEFTSGWFPVGSGIGNHVLYYTDLGMSFSLQLGGDSDTIDLSRDVTEIILELPFDGCTKDGIKIGSSMSEVKAVFNEPDSISPVFGDRYEDERIFIDYDDNNTVKRIIIH